MTIFLGIIDLTGTELSSNKINSLKNVMEDDIGEKCTCEFAKDSFYCVSFDSGAYKASGIQRNEWGVTLIVGDPIISQEITRSRAIDVFNLHAEFKYGVPKSLSNARGIFSGIHFDCFNDECYFFTDKLGQRSVYYYLKSGLLIFSSILSYLEKLSFVDLEEDFIGICESSTFTYPLGDRTQYKYIKLLHAGEIFNVKKGQVTSNRYWDWGAISFSKNQDNLANISQQAFDTFDEAVRLRIGDEKNAFAFLSGGLDSRCVTAAIKKYLINIHTFNFSKDQSQDSEFAKLYGTNLGAHHYQLLMEKLSYPNWSDLIAKVLNNLKLIDTEYPKYPQKVWSGDGGSMGAGFVYLDKTMIELLTTGAIDMAIERFLYVNKTGIPYRFISSEAVTNAKKLIHDNVSYEIGRMAGIPLEKTLYMFLLLNDQRRHLATHFETIGKHKIELMVPFYDSNFLSIMLSVPIKEGLSHKFYMKWFNKFPEFVRKTPWQTYPGHQKCPLEVPSNLSYQWENSKKPGNIQNNKDDAYYAMTLMLNKPALRRYINAPLAFFSLLLHRYKIRNQTHLVGFIKTLAKYIKDS